MMPHIYLSNNGTASVEFVLVFIILIMVMLGIVDFSRAWWEMNSLNFGAREGVRVAVTTYGLIINDPQIENRVKDALDMMIEDTDELTIEVDFANLPNPQTGDPITVTVSHTFNLSVWNFIPGFAKDIDLTGQSVMRYEHIKGKGLR